METITTREVKKKKEQIIFMKTDKLFMYKTIIGYDRRYRRPGHSVKSRLFTLKTKYESGIHRIFL